AMTDARTAKMIEGEPGSQQSLTRERERDARRIAGDPATPPLLGDKRRRAGAAGGIKDEVARISGHKQTPRYCARRRLNDIDARVAKPGAASVIPDAPKPDDWKIVEVAHVAERVSNRMEPSRSNKPCSTLFVRLPRLPAARHEFTPIPSNREHARRAVDPS